MKTERFFERDLNKAVELIKNGEIVAFPTDTVYGLGADARNEAAVEKIFRAKNRPIDRSLTVLVADKNDLNRYARNVPEEAYLLVDKFWPGPLTIVLNKKNGFASLVTGNLDTIGLRMPNHSLALKFINECETPLAAPSANSSGRPSPTTADHVLADLDGKIAGVVDGGETFDGIESTVLDLSNPKQPVILRPGGVTKDQIEKVMRRQVSSRSHKDSKQKEKNKHYEPAVPLYLVETSWSEAIQKMLQRKEKIGILANEEVLSQYGDQAIAFYSLGEKGDVHFANKNLFKALRSLEQSKATVVLAEVGADREFSDAYVNRLRKAASGKKI